jgi:hypothetical protein
MAKNPETILTPPPPAEVELFESIRHETAINEPALIKMPPPPVPPQLWTVTLVIVKVALETPLEMLPKRRMPL